MTDEKLRQDIAAIAACARLVYGIIVVGGIALFLTFVVFSSEVGTVLFLIALVIAIAVGVLMWLVDHIRWEWTMSRAYSAMRQQQLDEKLGTTTTTTTPWLHIGVLLLMLISTFGLFALIRL